LSLVSCLSAPALVGPEKWLPSEPFDYGWAAIGCNQLRCGKCKQWVRSRLEEARFHRHYECACQSRDEYTYHVIGSDAGDDHEFRTAWHCAGHPSLPLPFTLDGVAIAAVAPFAAIVSQTLATPPFIAPGFRTPSFWVQRLYRLLPTAAQQAAVGHGVVAQLSSSDAALVRAALDFFFDIPGAPGGEEIAAIAVRDRDRLRAIPDPSSPESTLYDAMLEAVRARLALVTDGALDDRAALDVARGALLAGEATDMMMYRVAAADPTWYCEHAADIVGARRQDIECALEALTSVPAAGRALALQSIERIDKSSARAVRAWTKEHPELFEQEQE
jgi:hypothetical protein